MKVKIRSTPEVAFRFVLSFASGDGYSRPLEVKEVEPSDSIYMVDDAAERIKELCGALPTGVMDTFSMLKTVIDEVFKLRGERPFSDNAKLPLYLDTLASANYLFNMMASGETGFSFVYERSN
jgi:hypothetical protein